MDYFFSSCYRSLQRYTIRSITALIALKSNITDNILYIFYIDKIKVNKILYFMDGIILRPFELASMLNIIFTVHFNKKNFNNKKYGLPSENVLTFKTMVQSR